MHLMNLVRILIAEIANKVSLLPTRQKEDEPHHDSYKFLEIWKYLFVHLFVCLIVCLYEIVGRHLFNYPVPFLSR